MCYDGRVPSIHICATGEPFLHTDILMFIDYAIKVYGKTSIQTNFYAKIFENNDYIKELIKRGKNIRYITTDVLSGDPQEHEMLKKGSKYHEVLDAMEILSKKSNIFFHVHLILTKYNYQNIDKLIIE